jgi:hypothetical protein
MGRPPRQRPVQFFTYGPWEFNINKAAVLAANAQKYRPELRWPERQWIGPFIEVHPDAIADADVSKPVIFATVIRNGHAWELLIDGNHRVAKALVHGVHIPVVVLDLHDTLQVLHAPGNTVEQMRRDGQLLGLLG